MRRARRAVAAGVGLAMSASFLAAPAVAVVQAPVGQGFAVTAADLAFILAQIKVAEAHVANTTSLTGPCGALLGTGPNQLASPLLSFGLRTVDGSCNNLGAGQETFGAADQLFPRLAGADFRSAEAGSMGGPPVATSYAQTSGFVFDSQPRSISNLVADQTSTNPAAVAAAGFPVRAQSGGGAIPCTTDPDPLAYPPVEAAPSNCTPSHQTLFIPNVTTDVGLSPPYNSLFTLFGQFFDHGVDQTVKGGGTVFVPLQADDPLIAGPDHVLGNADDLDENLRFMVLTRGQNQPGPDGVLGTADDVRDAKNTDTPLVDQSQTYTSHPSHQVFLREYANNSAGVPVSTGKLLGGPAGPTAGGMATWATLKAQAASLLGLELTDADVTNIPMIAADPYGNFLPGPAGLPQYVTASGLVEGSIASPVPVPADVLYFDTPFLTDIAHHAEPKPGLVPDGDSTASADFAAQPAGTYDDEMLDLHFTAGDGRVNENIGLTAIHQVFHSEHDRLVDDIENTLTSDTSATGVAALAEWQSALGADGWNGARLFQAARFVTEMEYQHLVFEEFARKVQPAINPFQPFALTQSELNPVVTAEFAHAVYRFGHSMLTETISRTNEGKPGSDGVYGTSDDVAGTSNDISLLDGFLNPIAYTDGGPDGPLTSEEAAGSVIMGMSDQVGNELDEFVTETLRNDLLGLPLDLATINLTRARSEGIPSLNNLRRELFGLTNDGALKPYTNWIDFGEGIKHPESLINFVAAYGQHPTILTDAGVDLTLGTPDDGPATLASRRAAARAIVDPSVLLGDVAPADAAEFMNSIGAWADSGTSSITGLDLVDLWIGGLAEQTNLFGGLLGSTFNYVFENQMTNLQNGDRLYYLARTPGMNLRTQLEGNSFAELMMRNTNAETLKADPFATADCKFELKNLAGTPAGFAASGNTVADDPDSECNETALLIRMPDGTIKYRARNSVNPSGINGQSVYNGTSGVDRVFGGNDSDTFWGGLGNDLIEGGDGADIALGGEGDDILTDLAGDDVPKGGPGNDAIDSGPGLDIIMAGEGNDFTNGGANTNETFAGAGNDFAIAGQGADAVFGDGGNDWEEGGDQPDLLIGDSSNLFFLDDAQLPGHDILIGQGGDDDYDMEGGDDIGVAGPGLEKVAGASGFDWEIGLGDTVAQDADLALPILGIGIPLVGVRDRYNEVEALSGWNLNDILRGDDLAPATVGGGGFIGCDALDQASLDRISGLDALVPALNTPLATVVALSASQDCRTLTGPNVWGDGNILLGGGGNDLFEGRGADDIIDGDRYLSVRLSVRTDPADPATEIGSASADSPAQSAMTFQYLRDGAGALTGPTLQQAVFAGTVNPGNIVAVREVLMGSAGTDTAIFSGPRANYSVVVTAPTTTELGFVRVTQTGVNVVGQRISDGIDTLRGVEALQFSDQTLVIAVPNAPAIGNATITSAGTPTGTATVRWAAPAPNGGPAITSYEIVVSSLGTVVRTITNVVPTARNAVVAGLTNGTPYSFQVRAVNQFGAGALSASSNVVTSFALPGAPTAVVANRGDTSVDVSWTAPLSNGGSPITGYQVQVRQGTTVVRTVTLTGPATDTVVTGLTNGTAYNFRVRTVTAFGVSGLSVASNTVTPARAPDAPVIGLPTQGAAGGALTLTARWTAPASTGGSPITNYRVTAYRMATDGVTPVGTPTVIITNGGQSSRAFTLPAGSYRFQVVAINSVGDSAPSAMSILINPR